MPNLATTPTVSGLAASSQFSVLLTLLVHPVKMEYHIDAPKEMPLSSNHVLAHHCRLMYNAFARLSLRSGTASQVLQMHSLLGPTTPLLYSRSCSLTRCLLDVANLLVTRLHHLSLVR